MRYRYISILILLGLPVFFYLALDIDNAGKKDKDDISLISIWEKADGNMKLNLTSAETEELARSREDAFLQGIQKSITDRSVNLTSDQSQPLTSEELDSFINRAIPAVMGFSSDDFEQKQRQNAKFFTKRGFVSFYNAIEASQIKQTIEKMRATIRPRIICVTQKDASKDEYSRPLWLIKAVIEYTYERPESSTRNYHLTQIAIMNKADESLSYQPGPSIKKWFVQEVLSEIEVKDKCIGATSSKP